MHDVAINGPEWIARLVIREAERLDRSPVTPVAAIEWASLIKRGLTSRYAVPLHETWSVIWAEHPEEPGKIIGFIVYAWPDTGVSWIQLGGVDPAFRRRGVYRRLYRRLREILVAKGCVSLLGGVSPKNPEATRAAMSLGRTPAYVVYEDDLTKPSPALTK